MRLKCVGRAISVILGELSTVDFSYFAGRHIVTMGDDFPAVSPVSFRYSHEAELLHLHPSVGSVRDEPPFTPQSLVCAAYVDRSLNLTDSRNDSRNSGNVVRYRHN